MPPQQEFSKDLSRNTGLGSQVLHVTWPCIRFLVDEMGLMLPLLTQTVSVLGFLLHRGMLTCMRGGGMDKSQCWAL